jgi:hypothetical protein
MPNDVKINIDLAGTLAYGEKRIWKILGKDKRIA